MTGKGFVSKRNERRRGEEAGAAFAGLLSSAPTSKGQAQISRESSCTALASQV